MTVATDNFHRLLTRRLGVEGTLPRMRNMTTNKNFYGYLEPKQSEKLFKSTYMMRGFFSSKEALVANGDLVYDRHHNKYGYVTELSEDGNGYNSMVYICNSVLTIAHPTETEDAYHKKTVNWATVVHHTGIRALLSVLSALSIENAPGSMFDKTRFYCYLQYSAVVHQGDRIYDGAQYYTVRNIDEISWNGALKCLELGVISV
jgi:hypothetical protein